MVNNSCNFCITGYDKTLEGDERIVMTYVPSHLYHILFELLKVCPCNSCFLMTYAVNFKIYIMKILGAFIAKYHLCFL